MVKIYAGDEVTASDRHGALAAVSHGVPVAIKDAVGPLGAPLYATGDDAAMNLPLGVAFPYRGKHFQVGLIENQRPLPK